MLCPPSKWEKEENGGRTWYVSSNVGSACPLSTAAIFQPRLYVSIMLAANEEEWGRGGRGKGRKCRIGQYASRWNL